MTILIHLWAIKTFLGKLPKGFVELYRNELDYHRNMLLVRDQLRAGWTPEALARDVCRRLGCEVGSEKYHVLLRDALEVKARFNV
jgi:hypothetical protein